MSLSSRKKTLFVTFSLTEGNFFNIVYSVLSKLSEYTSFHILKNITSHTCYLFLKLSKAFSVSLKWLITTWNRLAWINDFVHKSWVTFSLQIRLWKTTRHNEHPHFCWGEGGGGGLSLLPNFQKRGAWQDVNF